MKRYNVAIVGATGAVGQVMREILEERDFPINQLKLLASIRSAGKRLLFKGKEIEVEELTEESFDQVEIALFSAGSDISKRFAPLASGKGTVVIDNSSAFRAEPDVPLVVPEVNSKEIFKHKGIIANPNCSTIQLVVILKPIHDVYRIKRVVVSTYQAVTGTGRAAKEELIEQTRGYLDNNQIEAKVYPFQIAFNVLPHIDVFQDNLYTKEEMKLVTETKKIMGDKDILLTATTVRVPVIEGHSEAVNIELEKDFSLSDVRKILTEAPGVKVQDNPLDNIYPMPLEASGKDACYVGRIRRDDTIEHGINLWIVADNLRKGAALNAIQIAEEIVKLS